MCAGEASAGSFVGATARTYRRPSLPSAAASPPPHQLPGAASQLALSAEQAAMQPPLPARAAATRAAGARCRASDEPADLLLLTTDVMIIFAFSFARTLCTVLLSAEFSEAGGWLAPPIVDPDKMSATLSFAATCASLWVAGGGISGAFAAGARLTPIAATARAWLASSCLYLLLAFVFSIGLHTCIDPFCAEASLWAETERLSPRQCGPSRPIPNF